MAQTNEKTMQTVYKLSQSRHFYPAK